MAPTFPGIYYSEWAQLFKSMFWPDKVYSILWQYLAERKRRPLIIMAAICLATGIFCNTQAQQKIGVDFAESQHAFMPLSIPGLEDFVVIDIYKDSFGFMWFATEGGLYRYGGDLARPYVPPSDSVELTSEVIKLLYEDQNQFLWAITNAGGVNRIDLRTHELTTFTEDGSFLESSLPISENLILNIVESDSGHIWLMGEKCANEIYENETTNSLSINIHFYDDLYNELSYSKIPEQIRNRLLYLGWQEGLVLYDPVKNEFYIADISELLSIDRGLPFLRRHEPSSSVLLIDQSLNLYKIHPLTLEVKKTSLKQLHPKIDFQVIQNVFTSDGKTIWIRTHGQGLYKLNWKEKRLQQFSNTAEGGQ